MTKSWSYMALINFFLFVFSINITPSKARGIKSNEESTSKKQVCYKGFGCFRNDPPFNPNMPLPMSEQALGTKFLLRTRQHRQDVNITDTSMIANSTFDPTKPTKFIIHGFMMYEGPIAEWVPRMSDAILSVDDVNVVLVDWRKGALVDYDNAVGNTRMVGAQLQKLMCHLIRHHGAKARDFHLIGFSLGAHVAGFAGKRMNKKRRTIGRISGLDPANPAFNNDSPLVRLDKTDAKFIDIIHTDIITILHISSGMNRSLGHLDFWPNGGESQPGCHDWNKGFFNGLTQMAVCDHLRAPQLYISSITVSVPMIGYRCSNYATFRRGSCLKCGGKIQEHANNRCAVMGYHAVPPRGTNKVSQPLNYYLDTLREAPFSVRHYQVKIHWRKVAGKTEHEGQRVDIHIRFNGEEDTLRTEYRLLRLYEESGDYYHIYPGRTGKFIIKLPYDQDVGKIKSVTILWNRQTCWHNALCVTKENLWIKRIKVFDAVNQENLVFVSEERLKGRNVEATEVFEKQPTIFYRMPQQHHKKVISTGGVVEPAIRPLV